MPMTHCVSCGCVWGDGADIESHGICPKCFKEWVNKKKNIECYGEFDIHGEEFCADCFVINLCKKDSYGI